MDVLYTLALAKQAQGDVAGALPLFQRAAAAMPHNAEALTNYGLALVQNGEAAAGLRMYEQALAAGGDGPLLRQNMGVAYLQANDVEHAIQQFRTGLATAPEDVQLHYNLGLALKLRDDVSGATAELERAAALDPRLPDPPYTLGVLEMQQGQVCAVCRTPGTRGRAAARQRRSVGAAWQRIPAGGATTRARRPRCGMRLLSSPRSPGRTLRSPPSWRRAAIATARLQSAGSPRS